MEQQETSSFIIQCMNPLMGSDSFCLILQFTAVMSNYCHFSHFSASEIEIGHSYGACLRENGCVCCPFFFFAFLHNVPPFCLARFFIMFMLWG